MLWQKTTSTIMLVVLVLAALVPAPRPTVVAAASSASLYYEYQVVAKAGTGGLADLTSIDSGVSINDHGIVAFVGRLSNGQSVFVGDGSGDPKRVTPGSVRS